MKSYTNATNYILEVYFRRYNRILKQQIKRSGTSNFSLLGDTVDIGVYEDFFLGSNNDYFVVLNNQLEYHKF